MVEILEVTKPNDWYRVKGVVNGRVVEAEIHAYYVDKRGLNGGEAALARALEIVAQHEQKGE